MVIQKWIFTMHTRNQYCNPVTQLLPKIPYIFVGQLWSTPLKDLLTVTLFKGSCGCCSAVPVPFELPKYPRIFFLEKPQENPLRSEASQHQLTFQGAPYPPEQKKIIITITNSHDNVSKA